MGGSLLKNKLVWLVAIALLLLFVLKIPFGTAFLVTFAGLFVLLHGPKNGLKYIGIKGNIAYAIGALILIFGAMPLGAFTALGWGSALPFGSLAGGGGAAALLPGALATGTVSDSTALSACQAKVRGINPDNVQKSATLTVNAYDVESDTPKSSTVSASVWVFKNGVFLNTVSTLGGTLTNVNIGDVVDVYGGNATYYVDPKVGYCVEGAQSTLELDAHLVAATTHFTDANYDSTGSATMTAGDTNQEDSKLALGAGGADNFYTRFRLTQANRAFRVGGYLVMASEGNQSGYLDYFRIADPTNYDKVAVPKWAKGPVAGNSTPVTSSTNVSGGYDWVYRIKQPFLLKSNQEVKPNWQAKAAGSNNPVEFGANANEGYNMLFGIALIDADWSRASGTNTLDIHDNSINEGQVGLVEWPIVSDPRGLDIATLISVT